MTDSRLADARARAARTALLFLDVDGTLTDGRLLVGDDGGIVRAYNTQDGLGIRRLHAAGIRTAIVSAGSGDGIAARARQLGIGRVFLSVGDKLTVMRTVLAEEGLAAEQAAFMGDDVNDLPALREAGLACAPPGAVAEVLAAAHYVARRPAGMGAAREVCDFILASRGTGGTDGTGGMGGMGGTGGR